VLSFKIPEYHFHVLSFEIFFTYPFIYYSAEITKITFFFRTLKIFMRLLIHNFLMRFKLWVASKSQSFVFISCILKSTLLSLLFIIPAEIQKITFFLNIFRIFLKFLIHKFLIRCKLCVASKAQSFILYLVF